MAFAGCAFSMRSFQNYIPMKLYFTQDVKLDLCKSTGTKSQAQSGAEMRIGINRSLEGGKTEGKRKQLLEDFAFKTGAL